LLLLLPWFYMYIRYRKCEYLSSQWPCTCPILPAAAELELLQLLQPMASLGSGSGPLQTGSSSVLRMASRSSAAVQQQHQQQQQAQGQMLQLRPSQQNQMSRQSQSGGQGEAGGNGGTPSVLSGIRVSENHSASFGHTFANELISLIINCEWIQNKSVAWHLSFV
jgi:hypothetical protein